ncbi:MAG: hypothetical protein ACETWB_06555 [Anaerolineae bacterium]
MTEKKSTYYDLLGVPYDATTEQIREAYTRLREQHKGNRRTLSRLKRASLTLESSWARREYDQRNKIDQLRWRESQGIEQPSSAQSGVDPSRRFREPAETDALPVRLSDIREPAKTDVFEPPRRSRLEPVETDASPVRLSDIREPAKTDVFEPPPQSRLEAAVADVLEALPPVKVGVEPTVVDFGEVDDWESALPQKIRLRNKGKGDWSGRVRCTVPWLEVEPLAIECSAGKEVTLEARLNAKAGGLAVGSHEEAEAIVIEIENQRWPVGVRLEI